MTTSQVDVHGFIEKGLIYYSEKEMKFFIGAYGGMGNFDVQEVREDVKVELEQLLEKDLITTIGSSFTAPCVGVQGGALDDFVGYWTRVTKIVLRTDT
jgi:hypothetical protein